MDAKRTFRTPATVIFVILLTVLTASLAPAAPSEVVPSPRIPPPPSDRIGGPGEPADRTSIAEADAESRIPGRYIVVLKDSIERPGNVANAQAGELGGRVAFVYSHAIKGYSAKLSKGAVRALRNDPRVKYVAPDRKLEVFAQSIPAGIERVRATENELADIDGEDERVDVDVAVVDTGIDHEHPDLNVYKRVNCVPAGEGFESEEEFELEECVENSGGDGYGHGTHVAGTIGALDNGQGVVGVAPGARLWSVRVFTNDGFATASWWHAGFDWVYQQAGQIEVANASLGCVCPLPSVEEAIDSGVEAGVAMVVAAGNSILDVKDVSPAKNPNAITVSALADYDGQPGAEAEPLYVFLFQPTPSSCTKVEPEDTFNNYGDDDALAWFSNNGEGVDLAAPGVCVYSTLPNGGYGYSSGTSMSSPHVAGAAALLASESNPNGKEDVEAIRQQLVDDGSQNWSSIYFWNGMELPNSLNPNWPQDGIPEPLLDVGPQEAATYTTRPTEVSFTSASLNGGINPDGTETSYQFEYGKTTSYGTKAPASPTAVGAGSKDVHVSEEVTGLKPDTTYHYRLASTGGEEANGNDVTFKTRSPAITDEATGIERHRARLEGRVDPLGSETEYWFEYGTTDEYGHRAPLPAESAGSGTGYVEVSERVEDLRSDTSYHYRLAAKNAAGETFYGDDRVFETTWSTFTFREGKVPASEQSPAFLQADSAEGGTGFTPLLTLSTQSYGGESRIECLEPLTWRFFPENPAIESETKDYLENAEFADVFCEIKNHPKVGPTSEADLETNGCKFEFQPGTEEVKNLGAFWGTFDIVCPPGKAMVFAPTACEITIGPQTGIAKVYIFNGEGKVEVYFDGTGIEHTQSGPQCPEGTFHTGQLGGGGLEVSAVNADGEPITMEVDDTTAPRFEGQTEVEYEAVYPLTLTGEGLDTFETGGGANTVECAETSLAGELTDETEELELAPEYAGCLVNEQFPTVVEPNGCRYTLGVRNEEPLYSGALGVACEEPEEAIEYKVYLGESLKTLLCNVKVGAQAGREGVSMDNVGEYPFGEVEFPDGEVAVDAEVEGIEYEAVGSHCGGGGAGSFSDGVLSGETVIEATTERLSGLTGETEQVGVIVQGEEMPLGAFVAGEESEEEAAQPRFEAEEYPLIVAGGGLRTLTVDTGAAAVECPFSGLQGELTEAVDQLSLSAEHADCALGNNRTVVAMNSCEYVLEAANAGPPYAADLDVACTEEGDAITYKVYFGKATNVLVCTIDVGPQEGREGLALGNVGEGAERGIEVTGAAEGLAYDISGKCVEEPESRTDGVLSGDGTLLGVE